MSEADDPPDPAELAAAVPPEPTPPPIPPHSLSTTAPHELSYVSPDVDYKPPRYVSAVSGVLATLLGLIGAVLLGCAVGMIHEGMGTDNRVLIIPGVACLTFGSLFAISAIWWWGRWMIRRYTPLDTRRR